MKNVIDHIGYFKDTRKELKENAYFNLFLLCFILVLRISEIQKGGVFYNTVTIQQIKNINFGIEVLILSCVILILFLISETIRGVYKIYNLKGKIK